MNFLFISIIGKSVKEKSHRISAMELILALTHASVNTFFHFSLNYFTVFLPIHNIMCPGIFHPTSLLFI